MTKQEFRDLLNKKVLILDGATGSNLQKRGMPTGVCPELWISEHPEVLQGLQKEYAEAGSDIVYAPTFGGNRIKMEEYGLKDRIEEINTKLVAIAKEGVGTDALVAADLTMTGAQLEPLGDLKFEELIEVYKEQLDIVSKAGVDLVVVETMMSLQETRAAVIAAKEICPELPVMATLSFSETGKTLYGADAASCVVVLQQLGVDAVGINCSAGPDKMKAVYEKMKSVAQIPLIVKPNAGLPQIDAEGNTCYDMGPEEFKGYMKEIISAGAKLVGGCCGTSPSYIKALKEAVDELGKTGVISESEVSAADNSECNDTASGSCRNDGDNCEEIYFSSEREVFQLPVNKPLELGGGIDLSADEDILEEYQNDEFDTATDTAFDLMDDEVDALLFKADTEGIDEADALTAMISGVSSMVSLPVIAAVSSVEVAEKVLRNYAGVMGIMPLFDYENEKTEFFTTLKWYGAKMVTIDKQIVCC